MDALGSAMAIVRDLARPPGGGGTTERRYLPDVVFSGAGLKLRVNTRARRASSARKNASAPYPARNAMPEAEIVKLLPI